jgi:hypothetical protein
MLTLTFLLILSPCFASKAESSGPFSESFKISIDAAMNEHDLKVREAKLLQALRSGTDEEVLYLIPLLFPPELLNWVRANDICAQQTDDILQHVKAFIDTSPDTQDSFVATHSTQVRTDVAGMIRCMTEQSDNSSTSRTQSNNSSKPTPLRGAA